MPKKKNENQKTKEHFEEKEPAVVENSDNEDDVSIQDVFDFCDMLLDASFFKGEHDKEVFMELRKIIDSAYARRNKSKQDEDNYDEIIYNLTTNCIEDESLQDFMGYAYKKGKYDFCILNYEKYLNWTILAGSNGNGFSLSKLEMFFINEINKILSIEGINKIAENLEIEDERFIIVILKKLCDNMVRIMNLSAIELIKEPEVYLEQSEQLMRKYDRLKEQACNMLKEECEGFIESLNKLDEAEKNSALKENENMIEEKQNVSQVDIEAEAIKQADSSNKFTRKIPTKKTFRWWFMSKTALILTIVFSSIAILTLLFFFLCYVMYNITIIKKSPVGKFVNKTFVRDLKMYKIDRSFWEKNKPEKLEMESDGLKLAGYFLKCKKETNKLAVVIHGYFSSHLDMTIQARIFLDEGFNVFLPDLRAHGESEGKTVGMAFLDSTDVSRWIDKLIKELGEKTQIVVCGWSMGGATTLMLSGMELPENVKGFIADASYTSAYDEFKYILNSRHIFSQPLMAMAEIGAKLFGKYSLKSASAVLGVKKSKLPVLFIHGEKDTFVPAFMTDILFEAKSDGFKEKEIFAGAEHCMSYATDSERYISLYKQFINKIFG